MDLCHDDLAAAILRNPYGGHGISTSQPDPNSNPKPLTQESNFVTSIQRLLDYPLDVRFHYGHPDIFDMVRVGLRDGEGWEI